MRRLRSSGRRPPTSGMNFVSARSNFEKFSAQETALGRVFFVFVSRINPQRSIQLTDRVSLHRDMRKR